MAAAISGARFLKMVHELVPPVSSGDEGSGGCKGDMLMGKKKAEISGVGNWVRKRRHGAGWNGRA